MPKIRYIRKNFRRSSMEIIDKANDIIEDYAQQGLILTLRQLYYRFVAADLIPNRQKEYARQCRKEKSHHKTKIKKNRNPK